MILNATACKQISKFSGSYYIENWAGVNIQVYVQDGVKAFGEVTDALRIRNQPPTMEKPFLTPDSNKWETAINRAKSKGIESVLKFYQLTPENLELLKNASLS